MAMKSPLSVAIQFIKIRLSVSAGKMSIFCLGCGYLFMFLAGSKMAQEDS